MLWMQSNISNMQLTDLYCNMHGTWDEENEQQFGQVVHTIKLIDMSESLKV